MSFKNKRVLVTGSSGFIGSHLVQRLVGEGASVKAMVHYRSDPSLHNLKYLNQDELSLIKIERGNIEDSFFVRKCVEGCDIVFHLAALIGIPYSYIAPASYIATNISGALNVLEAYKDEQTPRLIITSTSEVYGTAKYLPIDENHPLQGQSPYSATKISADKLAESYFRAFNLPVVILRPFNTFGPRQSARAVIPTIMSQILQKKPALRLGNLEAKRDYTFVTDTIEAFILAGEKDGIEGETIHFGSGKSISIGELAQSCLKVCHSTVNIETENLPIRYQQNDGVWLDIGIPKDYEKMLEEFGRNPEIYLPEGA